MIAPSNLFLLYIHPTLVYFKLILKYKITNEKKKYEGK